MVSAYRPTTTLDPSAYGPLIGTEEDAGTSHFSVVDPDGNAVSVTTTINTSFGSYVYVPEAGIVLNNEMNDFSAQPGVPNAFGLVGSEANAIEPGKQPLSSMSPTIILEDGEVVGALGASGGPKIISGTLLTLLQLTQGAPNTETAIEYPRFHHQWMPDELEVDEDIEQMMQRALEAYDYTVVPARWSASVQAIWRRGGAWDASSDSAKHGEPAGY
jgi:gamma-glutamyltranspeptidase/glutathione hydrolase